MSVNQNKTPIGLQLFSVRGECARDLPATLKAAAEIGYVGVEPWGYGGDVLEWMGRSGTDLRKMLDDNGLQCCGMHLRTEALLGDNLKRTIELNQQLGNHFLIVAADKGRMSAPDTIMELAGILNETAQTLRPLGMWTGYHAHGFDFVRFGERTAWQILFANTAPEVVMQLDIGNCASGGGDPIAMLEEFPGHGGAPGSVIGEGMADWDTIFRLCETLHRPEWYVVEEGGLEGLGFDVCARSLAALHRMDK